MDLIALLDDFLRHVEYERNLSSHTTSQYSRDLREWLRYLERGCPVPS
jgi:site-specific recombinase XerD